MSLAAVVIVEKRMYRVAVNGFLRFAKRFFWFPQIDQHVRPQGIAIRVVGIALDCLLCRLAGLVMLPSVQENPAHLFESIGQRRLGLELPSCQLDRLGRHAIRQVL